MRVPSTASSTACSVSCGMLERPREVVCGPDRDHGQRHPGPRRRPRPRSRPSRRRRRRRSARAPPRRPRRTWSSPKAAHLGAALREQRLDLPRLARPGFRVGEQRDPGHLRSASWSGPRGPSGRSCWSPCASSRTASAASSPALPGSLRGRLLAGAEGLVDALLRAPRGARQQEREDQQDDADDDDDRDGQGGAPSLASVHRTPTRPAAPGNRGRIPRRGDRRASSAPTSASSAAPGCRCSSRASRPRPTSSTAPRRCSA